MHQCLKFILFGVTLYMFRTERPSETCRVQQALGSICFTYACCCMYSLELLMMDGKAVRNM